MRIDKYLTICNLGTRTEVKKLINAKKVKVNGITVTNNNQGINENIDKVEVNDEIINYKENYYFLLNKPKGYICATSDNKNKIIMELFSDLNKNLVAKLFPVGRLDIDTEGMLIVTNDGEFSHKLTSPKQHIKKVYFVEYDKKLPLNAKEILGNTISLKDGTIFQPSEIQIIDDFHAYLTIFEGQYHQVKRLIYYLGANVTYLKRVKIGNLNLPENLESGKYISLDEESIHRLFEM